MSSEQARVLEGTRKGTLAILKPYLVDDPKVEKLLEIALLRCWSRGFRMGRQEGRLDSFMLGGEGG